ncbi:MAG: hypothetical protein H6741_07825 [Alphaproteobacteria bacterium]|nr:hypothetical protein [Alphaproteobacteria bacterium]MCB9792624.1 hypothetical protein [Alphaproteobacteria bacterium]
MNMLNTHDARPRSGYVMVITLVVIAIIAVVGATTLSVAGVDHRIAAHNRKHMMIFNTSTAGVEHARSDLEAENPPAENLDSTGDSWGSFVTYSEAETDFGGSSFAQNMGVYFVEAVYERCGNPPPGYSTEQGRQAFRSDYWSMESNALMTEDLSTYTPMNNTRATTVATIRKVVYGACKVR